MICHVFIPFSRFFLNLIKFQRKINIKFFDLPSCKLAPCFVFFFSLFISFNVPLQNLLHPDASGIIKLPHQFFGNAGIERTVRALGVVQVAHAFQLASKRPSGELPSGR
jgi:hypothetical protein